MTARLVFRGLSCAARLGEGGRSVKRRETGGPAGVTAVGLSGDEVDRRTPGAAYGTISTGMRS